MTTITVYRTKDSSGAGYQSPPVVSRHASLCAAVTSAMRNYTSYADTPLGIFRDADGAEFVVAYRKHGHGYGDWVAEDGTTIEQDVQF